MSSHTPSSSSSSRPRPYSSYSGFAGGGTLSSLLGPNLSSSPSPAASSAAHSHAAKAAAIQRTTRERQMAQQALHMAFVNTAPLSGAASSSADGRAQTARTSSSSASAATRTRRAVAAGLSGSGSGSSFPSGSLYESPTPDATSHFDVDAKLHALDAQAAAYRSRIQMLERQLHVAQAAAAASAATTVPPARAATAAASSFGSSFAAVGPVDHFPLPPLHSPSPFTSSVQSSAAPTPAVHARPVSSSTARLHRFGEPAEEADFSHGFEQPLAFSPSPRASRQQQRSVATPTGANSSVFSTVGAAAAAASPAAMTSFASPLTAELISLRQENSGLHHSLSEHVAALERRNKEIEALREERKSLHLQLKLAGNLSGLLDRAASSDNGEVEPRATQQQQRPGTTPGRARSSKHHQQEEEKESSSGSSNVLKGTASLLPHPGGTPPWLATLISAQARDNALNPDMLHAPSSSVDSSSGEPLLSDRTSPLASPPRVAARSKAFSFLSAHLAPESNLKDRVVCALVEELLKEHTWIAGAYVRQNSVVEALVAHIKRVEENGTTGSAAATDSAAREIKAYFDSREVVEREKRSRADAAAIHAQARVLAAEMIARGEIGPSSGIVAPRPTAFNAGQQQQQVSGLVPGSAGAVAAARSRQSSLSSSPPTAAAPATAPTKNERVQVDGSGSAVIAEGVHWLSSDMDSSRPFHADPSIRSMAESLAHHSVRFVSAQAGSRGGLHTTVPRSAIEREEAFWNDPANAGRGYTDHNHAGDGGGTLDASNASTGPDEQPDSLLSPARQLPPRGKAPFSSGDASTHNPFRELHGQANTVPASVRKFASSVTQLDYIPAPGGGGGGSRSLSSESAPPASVAAPRPSAPRSYTQTAMGALSESTGAEWEDDRVEAHDPFFGSRGSDLEGSASTEWARMEKERIEKEREVEQQSTAAAAVQSIPASLQLPSTPGASGVAGSSFAPPPQPLVSPSPGLGLFAHTPAQPKPSTAAAAPSPAMSPPPSALAPATAGSFSLASEYLPLSSLKSLFDLLRFISFKLTHLSQLRHVVHAVRRMVSSDRVTLWFVDSVRGHIFSTIGTAVTNEIRVALGVGIAGGVAASGKAVFLTNATYDQRFLKKVESGTDYITRAVMAIPLKTPRLGTFAVLQVMNKRRVHGGGGISSSAGYFTRGDELIANIVAQALASNLWASEMFQLALKEQIKTKSIFAFTGALVSVSDTRNLLQALVARMRTILDADFAVLFAFSSNRGQPGVVVSAAEQEKDAAARHGSKTAGRSKRGGKNPRASTAAPAAPRGGGNAAVAMLLSESSAASSNSAAGSGNAASSSSAGGSSWAEDVSRVEEPLREELLSVTESCSPHIALLIPQGYASEHRDSDSSSASGFRFESIRVPLASGGLACLTQRTGKAFNIQDTRADKRFDPSVDEYVSDSAGGFGRGGGGGGGSSFSGGGGGGANCTRAFVSIPIFAPQDASSSAGSSAESAASTVSPVVGVLVLGKLVPAPFESWHVAELDEIRPLIACALTRYQLDREVNMRVHERLGKINAFVANLDLHSGGKGQPAALGAEDDRERALRQAAGDGEDGGDEEEILDAAIFGSSTSSITAAARGAVVVTEEGALSAQSASQQQAAARMKDPHSGEHLPSLAEYQRTRMLLPAPPALGSTLADALYKSEISKLSSGGDDSASIAAAHHRVNSSVSSIAPLLLPFVQHAHGGSISSAAQFSLPPMPSPVEDTPLSESDMRDPAPGSRPVPLSYSAASVHARAEEQRARKARQTRAADVLTLQREAPVSSTGDVAEEEDVDVDAEDALAAEMDAIQAGGAGAGSGSNATRKPPSSSPLTARRTLHAPGSRKASESKSTSGARVAASQQLPFGVSAAASSTASDPASDAAPSSSAVPLAPASPSPVVTLFKPSPPTLAPTPTDAGLHRLAAFHAHATSGGPAVPTASVSKGASTSTATGPAVNDGASDSSVAPAHYFNDNAASGFGVLAAGQSAAQVHAAAAHSAAAAAPKTVSRIALRDDTDLPAVDATKAVTYL